MILTKKKFTTAVEELVIEKKLSYIDAIVTRIISFSDAGSDFLFKSFVPGVGFH